jgi:serine/threonine protein kinase
MSVLPVECERLYTVVRQLGEGGFGSVWLAVHKTLGREVALKVLHASVVEEEQRLRFLEEARVTAKLSDPHIVKVIDYDGGAVPWIAYEYLPGRSVRDLLAAGPLPWREALAVGEQVCAALEAAHAASVVHRDIKAENVLEASPGHYKVADFGIARWVGSEVKTRTGFIMGTPTHLAPELWHGAAPDESTDVYALGIVLYELLVGELPFDGDNLGEILKAHLEKPAATPGRFQPDVPPEVSELVKSALAKDPAARFRTARQLRIAIRRALGDQSKPPLPAPLLASGALARPRHNTKRVTVANRSTAAVRAVPGSSGRSPLAIGLTALGVAGAVGLAVAWRAERPSPPPSPSPTPSPSASVVAPASPSPSLESWPLTRQHLLHAMHRRYATYRISITALPFPNPQAPELAPSDNADKVKPLMTETVELLAAALGEMRGLPGGSHWAVAAVVALETLRVVNLVHPSRRDPATVVLVRRMGSAGQGDDSDPFRAAFARMISSRVTSLMTPSEQASLATADIVRKALGVFAEQEPAAWAGGPVERAFVLVRLTLIEAAIREAVEKNLGVTLTATSGLAHAWNRVPILGTELADALTAARSPGPLEAQSQAALVEAMLVVQKLGKHHPDRIGSAYAPFLTRTWTCLHTRSSEPDMADWVERRGADLEKEYAKLGFQLRFDPRPRPKE